MDFSTIFSWTAGVFVTVFLLVLIAEALLSGAADETDWWKTREAWIQPLIAAGGVSGVVCAVWLIIRGILA